MRDSDLEALSEQERANQTSHRVLGPWMDVGTSKERQRKTHQAKNTRMVKGQRKRDEGAGYMKGKQDRGSEGWRVYGGHSPSLYVEA